MPLREHLRELRRRILWAALGLLVGAVVGWVVYDPIVVAMQAPLEVIASRGRLAQLNFGTVGSAFDLKIQVALFLGVFLSSPWWIGQLWMFVVPGLTRKERLYSLSFILAGAVLFVAGGALAWWVLPHAVQMLTAFTPDLAVNLLDARTYYTFFMRVILAFGLGFLLPLVMVGLNFLGVVAGRTYLKAWRWAVIGCFVFTAVVNPLPDAWSMIAMGVPLCGMYFAAVGISLLRDRRVARRRRAAEATA
ncbi:twin-arginine translocase subunit TatC [Georgenia sp. TF02-10]|uniref:twin-arginine translocase subunit TatC n=1 Tax=Georgenia sp. TF02-10 TaxID=2917725 RepID=UPI001FA7310C|nr:twin-arginine translocase subunit TatC [Georgenia sp. TF02-10]UNX53192.1 twin-arginine translocase subunit TatC [Georgenia sp. TF02-10]